MIICTDCNKECKTYEDYIEYPGTHCNFGLSGRHYLGEFKSQCCHADVEGEDDEMDS